MYIKFNVHNQIIKRTDTNRVVADSRNYLYAAFTFSEEWHGVKTAIFKNGDVVKHAILDDNDECLVPWEVIKPGILHVSVFCGDLITADTATVYINESGYADGGAPEDPTPTVYEQIISMLNEIETGGIPDDKIAVAVQAYLEAHPVESLTEEDVQRIVSEYVAAHKDELKGDKGETGNTPNLTIGTVETLPSGSDATATITGDKENPVLNLGIPKGADGVTTVDDTTVSTESTYSSSKIEDRIADITSGGGSGVIVSDTLSSIPDFGDNIINRPIEADAELSLAYKGKNFSGTVGQIVIKSNDNNTVAKAYKVNEGDDIALFGLSCSPTNRGWVFLDNDEKVIAISDKTSWGEITSYKGKVPSGATIAICVNRTAYKGMENDYGAYKPIKYYPSSILTGKKVAFCGDSYTYGDWTPSLISVNPLNEKIGEAVAPFENNMLKSYPWHIIRRTCLQYLRGCTGGNCLVPYSGSKRPFMDPLTTAEGQDIQNYMQIPSDTDYLILAFGLNECGTIAGSKTLQGVKGDTTTDTLWGCYDVLTKWLSDNVPSCKIGVIINDGFMNKIYHDLLIEICEYYQLPYFDMTAWNGNIQPIGCFVSVNNSSINNDVRIKRYSNFDADNDCKTGQARNHPSFKSHELRSYAIQSWIESL